MTARWMKTVVMGLCMVSAGVIAADKPVTAITGAGSSFIYPVLSKWTVAYQKKTGVRINYQDIGSGGGIQQLSDNTVNFAASDMPLDNQSLNKKGWTQFPMVSGGIVMVVNINGVTNNKLVLDGSSLAQIYTGKIQYWDNPALTKLNPGMKLPHNRIISVHRADGSGTTFNFTNYLTKVAPSIWKAGSSTVVEWPTFGIGAKGNAGVAATVQKMPNSIGYVEYTYATENNLIMTKMKNSNGKVVQASLGSFKAAAANANWNPKDNFNTILTNQPGNNAWPIVATTFIMLPIKQDPAVTNAALKFFSWSFDQSNMASSIGYVTMPMAVVSKIKHNWKGVFAQNTTKTK